MLEMKLTKKNYILNKKNIIELFNIKSKTKNQIIDILEYFLKNTILSTGSLNHIFNSILIIINYDSKDIKNINNVFKNFIKLDPILIEELCIQWNNYGSFEYNEYYDSIVFDTLTFFKVFEKKNNIIMAFNILHEILFNISKINTKLNEELKCKLYLELLKEIIKEFTTIVEKNENVINTSKLYITTVEACNITVRLINDWLGNTQ
jgi:hypothetical protein